MEKEMLAAYRKMLSALVDYHDQDQGASPWVVLGLEVDDIASELVRFQEALDKYDGKANGAESITQLVSQRDEAIERIKDILMQDDGQAYKEAEKFLDRMGT